MANAWPPIVEDVGSEPRRALTAAEWVEADEGGKWVDGWLVEEEVPDWTHELTVSWLIRVVGAWLGRRG